MNKVKKITKSNSTFQIFESIKKSRKKRNEHNKFIIEGVNPINLLLKNKWEIVDVIYLQGSKLSRWANEIIESSNANVYELSNNLYNRLSDKENPTEIIVTAKIREYTLKADDINSKDIFLVLDRIQNPGNLGTILRSANAVGVKGVALIGHSTDVYDMQAIRSSIGACFEIPLQYFESNKELDSWLKELKAKNDIEIIATSSNAKKSVYDFKRRKAAIILVGNETKGLSEHLFGISDTKLLLPMSGSVSSLNVATATTAFLYLILRP